MFNNRPVHRWCMGVVTGGVMEEMNNNKFISILTALTLAVGLGVAQLEIVDCDRSSAHIALLLFYIGIVLYHIIPEGD